MAHLSVVPIKTDLKRQVQEAARAADRAESWMVERWAQIGSELDIAFHSYRGRLPTTDEIMDAVIGPLEREAVS